MKDQSDFNFGDEEVSGDRLRYLLNQITYHFGGDVNAMRKTRDTLLSLIGEFAKDQTTLYETEHASRKGVGRKT